MNPVIKMINREGRLQWHFEGCEDIHILCAARKEILRLEKVCEILNQQLDARRPKRKKKTECLKF